MVNILLEDFAYLLDSHLARRLRGVLVRAESTLEYLLQTDYHSSQCGGIS